METYLTNKVTAANTVVAFCLTKPAQKATNPITAFSGVLLTVQNKLTLINGFDQIVVNGTSGVTLDTTNIRIAMVSIADKCANAVLAFANFTSNNTLAATVKYSPSALAKMSKKESQPFVRLSKKPHPIISAMPLITESSSPTPPTSNQPSTYFQPIPPTLVRQPLPAKKQVRKSNAS